MRVLMIGNNLGVQSGVQQYILNLLTRMDTGRYRIDLMVGPAPAGQASTEEALTQKGVRLILAPDDDKRRLAPLAVHLRAEPAYDIVHLHTTSKVNALACLLIRALCPRARLIVHAHTVYPPVTLGWRAAHKLYRATAHWFLGCSMAAGNFLFGEGITERPNFSIACNAVDRARFSPDPAARAALRAGYGIGPQQRVLGFVGRYNHEKNVVFIVETFAALHRRDPAARLILVGDGADREKVDAAIARCGVGDAVIQTGIRQDIPALMNAFDAFLLPSDFEGSPVTLVEAQGCGVLCFASTNVPPDSSVTGLVHPLPLDAGPEGWAAQIDALCRPVAHPDRWAALAAAGYEYGAAAAKMMALYDRLCPAPAPEGKDK